MASEIRVNKIANRAGLSTVEYTDTGIIVSGIVTCTEISGLNALNIAGVSTFASPLDINGDIDVDGHTNLDNLSVAGVSTFAGAIDLNADLDVDGHTNLDNVSIAGVTTFSSAINVANGTISRTTTGNKLIFQTDLETRLFHSSNNHVKLTFYGSGETLRGSIEAQATQIQIKDSGGRSGLVVAHGAESRLYFNDYQKFTTTNTGAIVTGVLTATSFSGDGSQLTGIAATTNVRTNSLEVSGVSTFTEAIYPNQGSYGSATAGKIKQYSNRLYVQGGTDGIMFANHANNRWQINSSGYFMPVTDSTFDIGDNTTRVRNIYADTYYGDGANLTNLPAGAPVGGASTNTVFFENDTAVAVNYQVTSGKNAMSAGPIAINAGIAVTVPSGSSWTIV